MPHNISAEWVGYTADKARAMLKKNTHNRNVRNYVVEAYARDMAEGSWEPTGEAIKVSNTGVLLDGQHRLAAVVYAEEHLGMTKPVPILTIKGLPDASQKVMDTGMARKASDALQLEGVTNASATAAAVKVLIRLERGTIFDHSPGASRVTHSEIMDWLDQHPTFGLFLDDYNWRIRKTMVPPAPMAAALWVLWNIDKALADLFLARLVSLEGLSAGSPILALSRQVTNLKSRRVRMEQEEWIGLVFHAWNRWRAGASAQYLHPTKGSWGDQDTFPWPKGAEQYSQGTSNG